jgi:hypothetical protein
LNGYPAAKRSGADPHGRGMLLLALTGFGGTAYGKTSSDDAFDHHLVKPVDLNQLARLLSDDAERSPVETPV